MSSSIAAALMQQQQRCQRKLVVGITAEACAIKESGQSTRRHGQDPSQDVREDSLGASSGPRTVSYSELRVLHQIRRRYPTGMLLASPTQRAGPHIACPRWRKPLPWGLIQPASAPGKAPEESPSDTQTNLNHDHRSALGGAMCDPPVEERRALARGLDDGDSDSIPAGGSLASPPSSTTPLLPSANMYASCAPHGQGNVHAGTWPPEPISENTGQHTAFWNEGTKNYAGDVPLSPQPPTIAGAATAAVPPHLVITLDRMAESKLVNNFCAPLQYVDGLLNGDAQRYDEVGQDQGPSAKDVRHYVSHVLESQLSRRCAAEAGGPVDAAHSALEQEKRAVQVRWEVAELRMHKAALEAKLTSRRVEDICSANPLIVKAMKLLERPDVRPAHMLLFLERELTRQDVSCGDRSIGQQGTGLRFGDSWRRLVSIDNGGDATVARVARDAVRGFLFHMAAEEGPPIMDLDPLECAAVSLCRTFGQVVLNRQLSVRHLFLGLRVRFLPLADWYVSNDTPPLERSSSRFAPERLANLVVRVADSPLAVATWAAMPNAGDDIFIDLAFMEAWYVLESCLIWGRLRREQEPSLGHVEGHPQHDIPPQPQHHHHQDPTSATGPASGVDRTQPTRCGLAGAAPPVCVPKENAEGNSLSGGGDAYGAPDGQSPLSVLTIDLLDAMIAVLSIPSDDADMRVSCDVGCGGVLGRRRGVGRAYTSSWPPVAQERLLGVELESPGQALALLLWSFQSGLAEQGGRVVYQPAVVMTPAVTGPSAIAQPGSGGPGALVELLVCRSHQLPALTDAGYKWNRIRERTLTVTATSNLVTLSKGLIEGMLRKRTLATLLQCKGVGGLHRMLQLLSKVRRQMLEAGKDLCFTCVAVLDWAEEQGHHNNQSSCDDDGGWDDREHDAGRSSAAGPRAAAGLGTSAPHGRKCHAKGGAAEYQLSYMEKALTSVEASLHILYDDGGEPGRYANDGQMATTAYNIAMEKVKDLLSALEEGIGGRRVLREGLRLEFMVHECVAERPWECVRPEVPAAVLQHLKKQEMLKRRNAALYG